MQTIRKYRIDLENKFLINNVSRGIAIFDLLGTFLGVYIILWILGIKNFKTQIKFYIASLFVGIIAHKIFNQQTFLNSKLFSLDINVYKILMLFLLIVLFVYH